MGHFSYMPEELCIYQMTVGHMNNAETSCYKRFKSTALQAHVSPK